MARFIPPLRLTSPRSNAESRCLEWLSRLPDAYVVLHSLGVLNHPFKSWAEIDALVVGPFGVTAVEVKGGRVVRRNGRWGFIDRSGHVTWKTEGPFDQVGTASAALRSDLLRRNEVRADATWGFAVLFPDCTYDGDEGAVIREVLHDASSSWGDPASAVARWMTYWARRSGRAGGLDAEQVSGIVESLRGDLDLVPTLAPQLDQVDVELTRLTVQQERVVGAAARNARLVVSGRAGTGKTMLALQEALRHVRATDGDVLVVSSGVALIKHMKDLVEFEPAIEVASAEDAKQMTRQFSMVIVDEAQDISNQGVRTILDAACVGGGEGGTWRLFLDPEQFLLRADGESPNSWPGTPTLLDLTLNCRNTRQIAVLASMLTRIRLDLEAPVLGPEPLLLWWGDDRTHDEALHSELRRLTTDLGAGRIAVLDPRANDPQWSSRLGEKVGTKLTSALVREADSSVVSTTTDFKGLEADAVIVSNVHELDREELRRTLYVACTRARAHLTVLLSEGLRSHYEEGAAWLGAALVNPTETRSEPLGSPSD